jgi:hypothetical protein
LVESELPKLKVAGSIPVARSRLEPRKRSPDELRPKGELRMRTKALYLAVLVLLTSAASQASGSDKKIVSSPEFPKPLGPYSQAVVAGSFVFVAGQGPINPKTQKMELGDIKSEARLELTNISNILKAANSSIENVVKVSVSLLTLMILKR